MTGGREDVKRALAEHYWSASDDETCSCGWLASNWLSSADVIANEEGDWDECPELGLAFGEWRAHVADVLAALSDERLAQAEAKVERLTREDEQIGTAYRRRVDEYLALEAKHDRLRAGIGKVLGFIAEHHHDVIPVEVVEHDLRTLLAAPRTDGELR